MNFKHELLLASLCAWIHLGSSAEWPVTCKIIIHNYCSIDTPVELQLNDTLKFTVDDAESIETLDFDQGLKLITIPPNVFKTFPAMERLYIFKVGLSVLLADRFDGAEKLLLLNIYNNNITVVPSQVFVNLPNTKDVVLKNCNIEIIDDNAFDGMLNLEELRIENNPITVLGRLAFAGAPNIKTLALRSNNIERIEEGALNLPNLKHLYLNNNQLTTLSDSLLDGAVNLYRLFFDDNKITHIGKVFNECNNLEILSLNNNPLGDIMLSTLTTVPNLKSLFLEYINFKLPETIPSFTPNESKLTRIWLTGNGLSSPDIFNHLSIFGQLEEIGLSNNNFTVFNGVDKIRNYFPKIKNLGLMSNEPSLCDWIKSNEEFLKNIRVWSSTSEGRCQSGAY